MGEELKKDEERVIEGGPGSSGTKGPGTRGGKSDEGEKTIYKGDDIKAFYKKQGRVPWDVENALETYKEWVKVKVSPEKVDTLISVKTFLGKDEKPRFDRLISQLKSGEETNPIIIDEVRPSKDATQVRGAFLASPLDGYARLAAHKELEKEIEVLIPKEKLQDFYKYSGVKIKESNLKEYVEPSGLTPEEISGFEVNLERGVFADTDLVVMSEGYTFFNENTKDIAIEQGYKYAWWRAVLDERLCERCERKNGTVKVIDDERYTLPPLHPRCSCYLELITPEEQVTSEEQVSESIRGQTIIKFTEVIPLTIIGEK